MECDHIGFEFSAEWNDSVQKIEFEKNLLDDDWKVQLDVETEAN